MCRAPGVRRELLYEAGRGRDLIPFERPAELIPSLVDGALARLAERSLLSFSVDGETVIAHRLVMRVVRDGLASRDRLVSRCATALFVFRRRVHALGRSPDRRSVTEIAEQVTALWDSTAASGCDVDEWTEALLELRLWVLYHLNDLPDSTQQAIAIGEALTADLEKALGPDNRSTLNASINLANAYHDAGRTDEAVTLHKKTLAARQRLLGPDHPDTVASQNDLALAYSGAGRVTEAIPLFEQALAAQRRQWPPDHPEVLCSLDSAAGRVSEAIRVHEQTLAARYKVLGPDHRDTLASQHNLAQAYQRAGRLDEAIALFEQTLTSSERALGPDHLSTLASRNSLALAYQQAGRQGEAISLFEQALAGYERILGPDHPQTLQTRSNLAKAYSKRLKWWRASR
jgi:tetratricopeptide (TPR) repeat protein